MGFEQVAAHGDAVCAANHDMRMERRLAVQPERYIAQQRYNLNLLIHRDLPVILVLPVEEPEHGVTERADSRELRGSDAVLPGEALDAADGFVVLVEDQHVSLLRAVVDELGFPSVPFGLSAGCAIWI
jgi:hypothetical protein